MGFSGIKHDKSLIGLLVLSPHNDKISHTEFSVRLDEMMIIFILEFINSDCTILSGLVSHFQKGITLGCLLLI